MQAMEAKSKMGDHLQRCLSLYNDCVVSSQKELKVARTEMKALEVECTNTKMKLDEEISKRIDLVSAMEADIKVCL